MTQTRVVIAWHGSMLLLVIVTTKSLKLKSNHSLHDYLKPIIADFEAGGIASGTDLGVHISQMLIGSPLPLTGLHFFEDF